MCTLAKHKYTHTMNKNVKTNMKIVIFSLLWTKQWIENNLKEERIVSAYYWSFFQCVTISSHMLGQNIMVAGVHWRGWSLPWATQKQRTRKETRIKSAFQSRGPITFPLSRLLSLKISTTSHNSMPVWGPSVQAFDIVGGFYIQTLKAQFLILYLYNSLF